jgi:hypothetical protein
MTITQNKQTIPALSGDLYIHNQLSQLYEHDVVEREIPAQGGDDVEGGRVEP